MLQVLSCLGPTDGCRQVRLHLNGSAGMSYIKLLGQLDLVSVTFTNALQAFVASAATLRVMKMKNETCACCPCGQCIVKYL